MINIVLFGGAGFVGIHYALKKLLEKSDTRILLADIKPISANLWGSEVRQFIEEGRLSYVQCDVRNEIDTCGFPEKVDLIGNFAAVHKEPGHRWQEYFETNVLGAENVCRFAEKVACNKVIFTSSISVYYPSDKQKNEDTLPAPEGAYGASKLVAERVHQEWKCKDPRNCLVVVRPGVVYGSGEAGNMKRMVQAIRHHYFAYVGNKTTRKASIYIKELCSVFDFLLEQVASRGNFIMANGVTEISPTVEDYVRTIREVYKRKLFVPALPYPVVLAVSTFMRWLFGAIGKEPAIDPIRVRKLRLDNDIFPGRLKELGYVYLYSMRAAFEEWKVENPNDWM